MGPSVLRPYIAGGDWSSSAYFAGGVSTICSKGEVSWRSVPCGNEFVNGYFYRSQRIEMVGVAGGGFRLGFERRGRARIARHRQGSCKWVEIVVVVETGVGSHSKTHPLKPWVGHPRGLRG